MADFIVDASTSNDVLFPKAFGRGAEPRDYDTHPQGMFAPPGEIPHVPESEFVPRIRDREKYKIGLRHLRNAMGPGKGRMPSKDQNGQGYCWAYSVTRTAEYVRAVQNLEYVPLSAHSVGCKVKGFRDEGAWCGLSAQFIRANGIVPESLWPAKSMNRAHDTAASWEEAKKYRITEDFVDLTTQVWDQSLTFNQVVSCLLLNIPCAVDFNWWGHSVCAFDAVERDGEVCLEIDNSWTDAWGENGVGLLRGQKKYPNGAVATRVVNPA